MLTVPEAARRVGRNPETVRRWIREGKLRAVKVGTQHVLDEHVLAEFLATGRLPARLGPSVTAAPGVTPAEDWLPAIVGRIVRLVDPVRIVLFGSRVRGDARPDSDYDLLVVLDEVTDRRAARIRIRRALGDLPVAKDVIVAPIAEANVTAPPSTGVVGSALAEGRVVYERREG